MGRIVAHCLYLNIGKLFTLVGVYAVQCLWSLSVSLIWSHKVECVFSRWNGVIRRRVAIAQRNDGNFVPHYRTIGISPAFCLNRVYDNDASIWTLNSVLHHILLRFVQLPWKLEVLASMNKPRRKLVGFCTVVWWFLACAIPGRPKILRSL